MAPCFQTAPNEVSPSHHQIFGIPPPIFFFLPFSPVTFGGMIGGTSVPTGTLQGPLSPPFLTHASKVKWPSGQIFTTIDRKNAYFDIIVALTYKRCLVFFSVSSIEIQQATTSISLCPAPIC